MSAIYRAMFNWGEEKPPDPRYIDTRRFDFQFSYAPSYTGEISGENTLLIRVVVPGLEAIELGQSLEKVLYWLAAQRLSTFLEKEATGLQLIELKSIPSYPNPSTIQYPPKDPFIVEVSRKIGFKR